MLAYHLKPILELLPEATDLVKKASIEQDLPVDNADSCAASALAIVYAEHVSKKSLDPYAMDKVASAVTLYDLESKLRPLKQELIKRANAKSLRSSVDPVQEYRTKEAGFWGDLADSTDVQSKSARAQSLVKQAAALKVEPAEFVRRYAAELHLDKMAAVTALAARYQATQDTGFAKIACAIGRLSTETLRPESVSDICKTVARMDKQAGLTVKGFDFYREALITKEAAVSALTVKLCGQDVPYESIERAGRARVAQYIGEDVAKEMDAGPANAKAVLETLPLDLQRLLMNVIKSA